MILVNRHTNSGGAPFHATLHIKPTFRVGLFDVRRRLREEFKSDFTRYSKEFYISDHTTAGYLDQRLVELLEHDSVNIRDYLKVFEQLFPPGAGYIHDKPQLTDRTLRPAARRRATQRRLPPHVHGGRTAELRVVRAAGKRAGLVRRAGRGPYGRHPEPAHDGDRIQRRGGCRPGAATGGVFAALHRRPEPA